MGVADTTAPASSETASDLRTAATHPAPQSADSPWLPLTTNARGIYFAAAIDPSNPCYNTAEVLQCPADTDLTLLREAFEQLYRENEGFRVRTRIADGAASQQILPLEVFLAGIDLLVDEGELNGSAEAGEENTSVLPAPVRAWAQRLLAQPLATDEGVTVRSAVVRYGGFLWVYHSFSHVVADGFAAFNGLSRVAAIYRALSAGQPVPATRRLSLQQLLDADEAASSARDEDLAFWENRKTPPWRAVPPHRRRERCAVAFPSIRRFSRHYWMPRSTTGSPGPCWRLPPWAPTWRAWAATRRLRLACRR